MTDIRVKGLTIYATAKKDDIVCDIKESVFGKKVDTNGVFSEDILQAVRILKEIVRLTRGKMQKSISVEF